MLKYKGYTGRVGFDEEAEVFHGEICGLRDVVTFEAGHASKLKQAFRDSIDDYLDFCHESGREPDKPCSGKFIVRIAPELHRELQSQAAALGVSLNSFVVQVLDRAVSAP